MDFQWRAEYKSMTILSEDVLAEFFYECHIIHCDVVMVVIIVYGIAACTVWYVCEI